MTDRTTPRFPLAAFLGMVTERAQRGSAVARVKVTAEHLNPHGSVHGAVLFAMVDTAMGAATMSVLDENQLCASIDVQVRFCKAAFDGELAATAIVLRQRATLDDGQPPTSRNGSPLQDRSRAITSRRPQAVVSRTACAAL